MASLIFEKKGGKEEEGMGERSGKGGKGQGGVGMGGRAVCWQFKYPFPLGLLFNFFEASY